MSAREKDRKIIVFSCSWHAYSSLESAGIKRLAYPATVYPIRLACLGRITPGMILTAFEKGAEGVFLIGCPEGECQHNSGDQAAERAFQEAGALLRLLGYAENQLQYSRLRAGEGERFVAGLKQVLAAERPPIEKT